MRPRRPAIITGAQREELWRRYKAGETILGIGRARCSSDPPRFTACCKPLAGLRRPSEAVPQGCSAFVSAKRFHGASPLIVHFEPSPGA